MTPSRVLPLVLVLAVLPVWPAAAQFGGMPGMPGSPGGMYPGGGGGSPFDARPQAPPPECQKLLAMRDETGKHGQALQAAGKRKERPQPDEICKLFKAFLGAEAKMIKGLEENAQTCGVPPDAIKSVKASHEQASKVGKNVCDAAAQGPRPAGPSLSDALGATPTVPDAEAKKRGPGTFDTLNGSPLTR
jgi:hypothetical protein